jgi:hypothetical protein
MPDGVRREMAANEHYLLAAARVPLPEGVTDDLLAGLEPAQPAEFTPAANVAAMLRSELAEHRALIGICETYARSRPEPKFADLCRHLGEGEQEIIYHLARTLRMAGEPAGATEVDTRLKGRGLGQESVVARLAFLRAAAERALARRRSQAAATATLEQRAGASDLLALTEAQSARIAAYTE